MKDNQATTIPHNILAYYQKLEEEHNRNIQVYQSLFDQNPEAVFSIDLNGNWEFYFGEFLEPGDFKSALTRKISYIDVPDAWDSFVFNGNKVGSYGYATYQ